MIATDHMLNFIPSLNLIKLIKTINYNYTKQYQAKAICFLLMKTIYHFLGLSMTISVSPRGQSA